ncbi:hypothetical protein IFM89_011225 [Coptis chinensis]|uniref:Uncharacterized protein n=1 Tax=Coptis chinensis TaxID=261450 RepID=A0A835HLT1_9MAGN|nr:hypothetical protein IFM89_011225 [Coptis chinensis]
MVGLSSSAGRAFDFYPKGHRPGASLGIPEKEAAESLGNLQTYLLKGMALIAKLRRYRTPWIALRPILLVQSIYWCHSSPLDPLPIPAFYHRLKNLRGMIRRLLVIVTSLTVAIEKQRDRSEHMGARIPVLFFLLEMLMLEEAKLIGAGAATIASAGAAVGIGILSSLVHSVARNPSLAKQSFDYVLPFLLFMEKMNVGASFSKNNAPPDPADDGKGRGHNTPYWALYVRALDHLRSEMKKQKGRPISHGKA